MKKTAVWLARCFGLIGCLAVQTSVLHAQPSPEVKNEIRRILFGEEGLPPPRNVFFLSEEAPHQAGVYLTDRLSVYFNPDPYSEKPNVECRFGDSSVFFRTLSEIRLSRSGRERVIRQDALKKHHDRKPGSIRNPQEDRFVYPSLFVDPKEGTVYSAEYFINSQGTFLEEIILDRPQEVLSVSQEMFLKNADIREGKAGSFDIYQRGSDRLLFSIPVPKMYEKNNPTFDASRLSSDLKALSASSIFFVYLHQALSTRCSCLMQNLG